MGTLVPQDRVGFTCPMLTKLNRWRTHALRADAKVLVSPVLQGNPKKTAACLFS
jgi:hypothetical protein